jgi:hypothetical protein
MGAIRELAMTTKELCDALRHTHPSRTMCKEAADVIERLAAEIALDKFKRGRIAHKAAMAIRPETVGDGEYWRLRCAINDTLREELAQSDAEPVCSRS